MNNALLLSFESPIDAHAMGELLQKILGALHSGDQFSGDAAMQMAINMGGKGDDGDVLAAYNTFLGKLEDQTKEQDRHVHTNGEVIPFPQLN